MSDYQQEIINRIENAFESGRKTAFTQAAERFDGTLPFNWVAADGYANATDIAGELRYMARDVQDRRKSESEMAGIPRPAYDSALLREAIEGVRA